MAGSFIALNITGWRELEKALRDLGDDKQVRKLMKVALSDAAEPIARDARARVPVKDGGLRDSIEVRPKLNRRQSLERGGVGRGIIGENLAEAFVGPTWPEGAHGHLVEFGTGLRTQSKTNRFTGHMPPHPFMRPAWEAGKRAALDEFGARLGLEVERAAERIAKKNRPPK